MYGFNEAGTRLVGCICVDVDGGEKLANVMKGLELLQRREGFS